MDTSTFHPANRSRLVPQSLVPRRICLAVLIIGMPCAERVAYADNFTAWAALEVCCDDGGCETAICTLDGKVDFLWDTSDCYPTCTVTPALEDDSGCTVDDGPFRLVRVLGSDEPEICDEDTSDPFEVEFYPGTDFTLTHSEMCLIMDPDQHIVVVGPFTGNGQPVTLTGGVTPKTNFTCHKYVPAVSEWGLIAMTVLVLVTGTVVFKRRRTATA